MIKILKNVEHVYDKFGVNKAQRRNELLFKLVVINLLTAYFVKTADLCGLVLSEHNRQAKEDCSHV